MMMMRIRIKKPSIYFRNKLPLNDYLLEFEGNMLVLTGLDVIH